MAANPITLSRLESKPHLVSHAALLAKISHLLLQDTDPDSLCRAVFEMLRVPFGIDVYFHYLISGDETHLELASSGGNNKVRAALGSKLDFGSAVCGLVARERVSHYFPEVNKLEDDVTSFIRNVGVKCYVCHPLIMRGHLLGTLSFGSTRREMFSDEELDVFEIIAGQVTLATDRRSQSDRLRQLERLATAGRMSATLAHEINNPLESLGNLLYLLRGEVHTDAAEDLLTKADGQVVRLAETAQRTLEMFRGSRQSAGRHELSSLVQDLVNGLQLPHHARLESEIEEHLCAWMVPGEMRQVLFNLLTNAAQFTRPGTPVRLRVERVGEGVEIRVRDEGPGISNESRPHIFQPFYTTRGGEGTGIGLWLSREMLGRAGGTLTFVSDPLAGPGTEFIATLPLAK